MVTPCVTMVTSVPVVPALFRSSTCFLAVLQTFVPPGGGDGQGSVDLFVHPVRFLCSFCVFLMTPSCVCSFQRVVLAAAMNRSVNFPLLLISYMNI